MREGLCKLGTSEDFLDKTHKKHDAWERKVNHESPSKLSLCFMKDIIEKLKRQAIDWRKFL